MSSHCYNHDRCVTDALAGAERYCRKQGLRFTRQRHRVLELVWCSHRPMGAYAILEQLGDKGHKPAPPTVYRALDFLLEHGLIHRIDSLNSFVGCPHPGEPHTPQFFICKRCGDAIEVDAPGIRHAISGDAERLGFQVERQVVEVAGVCAHCNGKRVFP